MSIYWVLDSKNLCSVYMVPHLFYVKLYENANDHLILHMRKPGCIEVKVLHKVTQAVEIRSSI